MKKIFFAFSIILFLFLSQKLSAQNWLWGKAPIAISNNQTTAEFAEGWDVATDNFGNAFLNGVSAFEILVFDGDTLYSDSSATKTVLAKYDSAGNFIWAKTNSNQNGSQDSRIETDIEGNIYEAGSFYPPSISFDSFTVNNSTTGGANDRELFMIKYKSNGNISWLKNIGGQGCSIDDIKTDNYSNVYISGYFITTTITFGTTTLTNHGYSDVFILKLDSSGNILWAKSFGGTDLESQAYIAVTNGGAFYLTATFYSDDLSGVISISNPGSKNILIAKFDNSGNLIWVKSTDSYTNILSKGIVVNNAGQVIITGNFTMGDIYFDSYLLSDYNSGYNVYLAAYDTTGNLNWVKSGEYVQAYCLTINSNNNIFLSGQVTGSQMLFGNYQIPWTPTVSGDYMFVVKFNPLGYAFCGGILSSGGDDINAIAVNNKNQVFVGGDYLSNPFVVGNDTLPPPLISEQLFIARYASCLDESGIDEITLTQFTISPNPANTEIKITNLSTTENQISIFNLLGQQVKSIKVSHVQSTILPVSDLPTGIYVVTIFDGEKIVCKKFVKE